MDSFDLQDARTKSLNAAWKALQARKTLFVMDKPDRNLIGAGRNIEGFGWAVASNLNAYQVLNGGTLIFSAAALKALEKSLGEGK
jgi:ribosomal protein L4